MHINKDIFSSGQVGSKIWLCEELEKLGWTSNLTYIYGGWCGVLGFLLLSRGNFQVNQIQSFDIDPTCEPIADMINGEKLRKIEEEQNNEIEKIRKKYLDTKQVLLNKEITKQFASN